MKGSKRGPKEIWESHLDFSRTLGILHMLVSYKWLKELVDIDVPSQELAEKMSTTGI